VGHTSKMAEREALKKKENGRRQDPRDYHIMGMIKINYAAVAGRA